MKRKARGHDRGGPSQRQLRAAELVRHALVDIIAREDLRDPDLQGAAITIGEVRASPDLKHMTAFVSALGPTDPQQIARGLTRSAGFLRGKLARAVDLRFTPELHFEADVSYDEARHIDELLASPEVARDLNPPPHAGEVASDSEPEGESRSQKEAQPRPLNHRASRADSSPASGGAVGEDEA